MQICCFVHVPHTAGCSVGKTFSYKKYITHRHHTLLEWKEILRKKCRGVSFKDIFKFAFVRNPYDIMVTVYCRQKQWLFKLNNSFPSFTEWLKKELPKKALMKTRFRERQLPWIIDENNKINLDFLGRYEHLQRDFLELCKIFNVHKILPHDNKTLLKRQHYIRFYTKKAKELVTEYCKEDIEMFGYCLP